MRSKRETRINDIILDYLDGSITGKCGEWVIPPSLLGIYWTVNIEKAAFEKRLHLFPEAREGDVLHLVLTLRLVGVVIHKIKERGKKTVYYFSEAAGKTLEDVTARVILGRREPGILWYFGG